MHRRARSDAVSRSATALCDRDQAGVGHHDAEGGEDGSGSGAPRDGARAQSAAARDAKLAKKESRIAALLEDAIDEPEGGGRHGVRPGSAATRLQGRRGAPGQRPARRRRDKSRNSADGADVGAAPASVAAAGPAARAARRPASAQPTGGGLKAVRARRSGVLEPQGHKRAPQRALDASPLSPRPGTASPSGAGLVDSMAASRRTRRRPRPATATATPNPGGRSPSRGGSVTFAAAADAGPTHRSRPSSAHYLKMAEERRRKREAAFAVRAAQQRAALPLSLIHTHAYTRIHTHSLPHTHTLTHPSAGGAPGRGDAAGSPVRGVVPRGHRVGAAPGPEAVLPAGGRLRRHDCGGGPRRGRARQGDAAARVPYVQPGGKGESFPPTHSTLNPRLYPP